MRTIRPLVALALTAALTTACAKKDDAPAADSARAAEAGAAKAPAANPAGLTPADPTVAPAGAAGVPTGFQARTDDPGDKITDVKYTPRDNHRMEIQTGPHHIIWDPGQATRGVYAASATIEQLEAPHHPESFGIFVGGSDLSGPNQRYGYLMVRGTGEFLVKVREGSRLRTVFDWTKNPAIPAAGAGGKASYDLKIAAGADSVRFSVNGKQVAATPKANFPTDGIPGLRVGHNLHVSSSQLTVTQ